MTVFIVLSIIEIIALAIVLFKSQDKLDSLGVTTLAFGIMFIMWCILQAVIAKATQTPADLQAVTWSLLATFANATACVIFLRAWNMRRARG